jgi:hypothetical protein
MRALILDVFPLYSKRPSGKCTRRNLAERLSDEPGREG